MRLEVRIQAVLGFAQSRLAAYIGRLSGGALAAFGVVRMASEIDRNALCR